MWATGKLWSRAHPEHPLGTTQRSSASSGWHPGKMKFATKTKPLIINGQRLCALYKSFPCLRAPSPGHSWGKSELWPPAHRGLRAVGNERRDISKTIFITHKGKLASEQRLQEWSTYFWGNSCGFSTSDFLWVLPVPCG